MTAREELARSISANLSTWFGTRSFGPAHRDYELADALLAEGWGKRADAWDEGYLRGQFPWKTEAEDELDPIPECFGPPRTGRNANPHRPQP